VNAAARNAKKAAADAARESLFRRGAAYMLVSALLFSGMGALVKLASAALPNELVVFFRNAMGLVFLLPWLSRHGWHHLKTRHPGLHLVRAAAGLGAMYCYFYAIAHLPLAEATLLNYSTPLFVPFIAALWLRERVARSVVVAAGLGFLGVILVLKPNASLFASPEALVGLASGGLAAVAMVGIRRMHRSETAFRIVFYFTFLGTLVSAVPLLWRWQSPPPTLWLVLIAMGALASLAQLAMTRAYACAPAAQVGPFSYATVVFAALWGALFWGETVDIYTGAGAVLVATAGILAIRHAGRRAAPLPDAPVKPG
jgi:drug/metabolite transporter (DMT)-like permease